ncbi:SWIM zinc finger family protein [Spirilliplanes yamanashiensis]|uniref:SWIM-type domain-containing protein n=1 Tax=Spirilliplanes yamanashiensis TaxID=42233 RepID=A0A8J4DJU6_9ACTN|nr:SWIM zinc finger family protein [Spirilliplanes yamanashiensis]GIJ03613.1 hypothetical protein Sya03_29650 [Spirilliplanes yamanashiensis]
MPVDPTGRFFEGGQAIRVEGGIAVRSKRGDIGSRWWSRRFVDQLERICDGGRLSRGRAYARKGQVLGFDLTPGVITGQVQGSRPDPYEVSITIGAFGDDAWAGIVSALGAQALFRAALLAGDMPTEIVGLFDELGHPLFPESLEMECSCPDWGRPCKHLSAVLYVLAEAFDDDPFLVLAWRGRDRDTLLAALRATPGGEEPADPLAVEEQPLEDRLRDFYAPAVSLGRLRERPPRTTTPPELLLRAVDPPKVRVRHIPLVDVLRQAYRGLGRPPS